MCFFKKKIVESKIETPVIPEVKIEEPPKETTRRAMMEITVINNKTDAEYIIKSDNEFGLNWSISDKCININQLQSISGYNYVARARFIDFSVSETVWQTFDIV